MTLDLGALFSEMDPRVRAYFGRRAPSVDADDLAGAVWLKAAGAAPRYRDYGAPHAWLWTIARNVYRDYLTLKRHHDVPLDTAPLAPHHDRVLDLVPLYDAMSRLRPDQRRLLADYYAGGYAPHELAERFGTTVMGAKLRRRRALAALRRQLELA